jgi:cation/acetate symporter
MNSPARLRTPNPHLGAYYCIITSAFASLAIMLALFEQLGWNEKWLAPAMVVVPVLFYLGIGMAARTLEVGDYFASGRRVPPVFNGAVMAAIVVGGVGFFAYVGTVFFLGFDALAIGLGLTTGALAAAVLFAPYLRKAGSYTLPSFLGHRFRSRALRIMASLMQLPPTALLLAAELKLAALVAALFLPVSYAAAVIAAGLVIAAVAIAGGMRALTWSGSAEFIVSVLGLAAPLIVASILLTNLPTPQLTYGEAFAPLQKYEITAGLTPSQPEQLTTALPGAAPRASEKPFLQSFGAIAKTDFMTLFLCLAVGTAALPSLLVRSGVASSVADQRKSGAWAVLFVALFAATAPGLAAFVKLLMFQDITQFPAAVPPAWLGELSARNLAFARDINADGVIEAAELFVARDGVTLSLAPAAGLPLVCTLLVAAAGLAIALAAAASHLFTLASSVAEDVVRMASPQMAGVPRLAAAWVAVAAAALGTAVFLSIADIDLMQAALTAFAFAAATFFPVLLLSIWWPRCTRLGAMAAMVTGFAVMGAEIIFGRAFGAGEAAFTITIAALIGALLALVAGVAASLLRGATEAEKIYYEDLRDPAGDALYDRAQRRAAASSS